MFVVVAYDISDKRTLRRVMKLVEGYGVRRQKSVFECDLDERRFVELRGRLSEMIDPAEDRVCYYHLCASCRERIEGLTEHEHPAPRKGGYTIV